VFGAKTGQKIVLIQYKKDFVPLILSDLVHRASHITLLGQLLSSCVKVAGTMRPFYCLYSVLSLTFVLANSRDLTVELVFENNFSSEDISRYPQLKQNEHKLRTLAKTFAIKPTDDAAAITATFCAQAEKLGMGVNQQALLNQVEDFGNSQARVRSAYVEPAILSPVPFSFHRFDASPAGAAELAEHVRLSIVNARSGLSRILAAPDVLKIEGMSDDSVRHLLNNLMSAPGAKYLEVGSWRGSTFVSALVGNEQTVDNALAIDAWTFETDYDKRVFGTGHDSLAAFENNMAQFVTASTTWRHIRCDFRSLKDRELVSAGSFKKELFNVYLFDGPHEAQDHEDALTLVLHHLDRTFVYVVDDWNYGPVQEGTYNAISKLGLEVLWAETLGGSRPNGSSGPWHNGMWVGVLRQP